MAKPKYPKKKEALLVTSKGTLLSGLYNRGEQCRHYDKNYTIMSDASSKGIRTIVLKEMDRSSINKKRKELIEAIARAVGESNSKTFRDILADALIDDWDESIENLYDKVVKQKQCIKTKPGCFKITIGDARKKGSSEIMLRD